MRVFEEEIEVKKKQPTYVSKIRKIVEEKGYTFLIGGSIDKELLYKEGLGEITYNLRYGDGESQRYQFIAPREIVDWLLYYGGNESINNLRAATALYNEIRSEVWRKITEGGGGNNPHYHVVMFDALMKYITALMNFVLYSNPHTQEFNHSLFEKLGLYDKDNWERFNEISLAVYGEGIDKDLTEEKFKEVVKYIGYKKEKIKKKVPYVYYCKEDVGSHIEIKPKVAYRIVEETVRKEIKKETTVLKLDGSIKKNPLHALEELASNLNYSNLSSPFSDVSDEEYRGIIKEHMVPTLCLYLNIYHKNPKLPVIPPHIKE